MNDLKPGPLVALGGAVVLIISTFLPWIDVFGFTENGLSSDFFGLIGVIVLIIGIGVGVLSALTAFAPQVNVPDDSLLGFTASQRILVLGVTSFLITFGLQFRSSTGVGILIGWIGAAIIVVGAVMQSRETASPPAPGAPPAGGDQPGTF